MIGLVILQLVLCMRPLTLVSAGYWSRIQGELLEQAVSIAQGHGGCTI
jgi:hypothetical protein